MPRNLCKQCCSRGTVKNPQAAWWKVFSRIACTSCGGDGYAKPPRGQITLPPPPPRKIDIAAIILEQTKRDIIKSFGADMAINLGPMLIEKKKLTTEWLNETCGDTAHTVVPHGHYWALVNVDHGCELQVHRDGDKFYAVFRDHRYKYFDCPRFIEYEDDIVELCRILGFSCGESENNDNCRGVNYGT